MLKKTDNRQNLIASILSLTFMLITIAVNTAAVVLPLNGVSTKELADKYDSLITPAGLTFSIWSIIYLFLIIWTVRFFFQALSNTGNTDFLKASYNLTPYFIATCIWNSSWLIAWHHENLILSVIIMLMLLITLIKMNILLDCYDLSFLRIIFSVYLGWISVATVVNISAVLNSFGINPFGFNAEVWSIIMPVIIFLLAFYISLLKARPAFAVVISWALYGIYLKNSGSSYLASILALFSILSLLIAFAGLIRIKRKKNIIG